MNSPDYQDKYYSIIEEENKQKLKLQLEQEKERLKSLMPNITTFNLNGKSAKDDYDHVCLNPITTNLNLNTNNAQSNTNNNSSNSKIPILNMTMPVTPNLTTSMVQQQQQQQSQQHFSINSTVSNNYYLSDANKAFDDVVFDILKVDPDYIAVSGCLFKNKIEYPMDLPLSANFKPLHFPYYL